MRLLLSEASAASIRGARFERAAAAAALQILGCGCWLGQAARPRFLAVRAAAFSPVLRLATEMEPARPFFAAGLYASCFLCFVFFCVFLVHCVRLFCIVCGRMLGDACRVFGVSTHAAVRKMPPRAIAAPTVAAAIIRLAPSPRSPVIASGDAVPHGIPGRGLLLRAAALPAHDVLQRRHRHAVGHLLVGSRVQGFLGF